MLYNGKHNLVYIKICERKIENDNNFIISNFKMWLSLVKKKNKYMYNSSVIRYKFIFFNTSDVQLYKKTIKMNGPPCQPGQWFATRSCRVRPNHTESYAEPF